jgi:putative methyltransferase (TIGR04325 family)
VVIWKFLTLTVYIPQLKELMSAIKDLLPPLLFDQLRQSRFRRYGWFGSYISWEEAEEASVGYDSDLIIEKVLDATLKVKNGEFPYERDSVLFDEIHYDWPLLAGLMWVASRNKGELDVLDFGGSLGSTYWQNKKFLTSIPSLNWSIIEQTKYVDVGREHLQDSILKFYYTKEECLQENKPNLLLLSSVLSYIKEPFDLLNSLFTLNIKHVIIERILFIEGSHDRLTVQRVTPKIYDASYPCWFFSESKFMDFVKKRYDVLEVYDCGLKLNLPSSVKGLILTLKK